LSIQAFQPVLIEGKAIQVHPLVCTAFNADFDGDQMAVHLPLSEEAQKEARYLIASNKNLLKPQDGNPITTPAQDMVLGCFWMTKIVEGAKGEGKMFSSPNEAITAYDFDAVDFRAKIKVLPTDSDRYAEFEGKPFETTVGRLLFNTVLPKGHPYINAEMKKKDLSSMIEEMVRTQGVDVTAVILDKIKDFGNKYVTLSGSTWGMDEALVPEGKKEIVRASQIQADEVESQYDEGLISSEERYRKRIEIWEATKIEIGKLIEAALDKSESVYDMVTSKARGSVGNMTQMAGMKGMIVNTQGRTIDFPIIPSYKEGLSPTEYFITTHGARKGLTDTALNTAKAGYLTRRLVDVAQDIVVTEEDCGTKEGVDVFKEDIDGLERPLSVNIVGRVPLKDIKDADGNVVAKKGEIVIRDVAKLVDEAGIEAAFVRSPLTCETRHGLCQKCYGLDMGRGGPVKIGEAVGIIAAQAIGEPGTQLTLRTFHAGGVTGLDITAGLPRVEEIFERRNPKTPAVVCEMTGEVVEVRTVEGRKVITVLGDGAKNASEEEQQKEYIIDPKRVPLVKKGDRVEAGEVMTDGSASILEVFEFGGQRKAENYVINEINKVYDIHASPVAPKHIEIVVRQMFSRRKVTKPGDTRFTTGEVTEFIELATENDRVKENGGEIATADVVAMGISEVSLTTKSWLSSASFQHTTRTLIANAIRGEKDILRGLKENVILGGLIPAGTGLNENFIEEDAE
jgi:DNA-directed RNA polymerase subunit beta'